MECSIKSTYLTTIGANVSTNFLWKVPFLSVSETHSKDSKMKANNEFNFYVPSINNRSTTETMKMHPMYLAVE